MTQRKLTDLFPCFQGGSAGRQYSLGVPGGYVGEYCINVIRCSSDVKPGLEAHRLRGRFRH